MNGSDYIFREYPKLLTTPRGPVIVRSIAEEHALRDTPSVAPDRMEKPTSVLALPTAQTQVFPTCSMRGSPARR